MRRIRALAILVLAAASFPLSYGQTSTHTGHENEIAVGDYAIIPAYIDTFPTALLKCFESFHHGGPVAVHIKNNSDKTEVFTVSVSIQDFTSSPGTATKSIAPGDTATFSPSLFIDPVRLAALTSLTQSNYQVSVSTLNGEHRNSIYKESHLVQLMAADVLPWRHNGQDMSMYVALWVTPTDQAIQTFLAAAKKYSVKHSFMGYQWGAKDARVQVKAIYKALKKKGITYSSTALSFPAGSQKIRFPADALSEASANCIDGSILMASALEAIGIEPLLVIVPGHCFLGWKELPGSRDCEFLETTMIGTASFEAALDEGYKEYTNYFKTGRAKIIDIKLARSLGLMPLR